MFMTKKEYEVKVITWGSKESMIIFTNLNSFKKNCLNRKNLFQKKCSLRRCLFLDFREWWMSKLLGWSPKSNHPVNTLADVLPIFYILVESFTMQIIYCSKITMNEFKWLRRKCTLLFALIFCKLIKRDLTSLT